MDKTRGHREVYPYITELREQHPGCWLYLTNIQEDNRKEIINGTVASKTLSLAELDSMLPERSNDKGIIIPPTPYSEQFGNFFGGLSSYSARKKAFNTITAGFKHHASSSQLATIAVSHSTFFPPKEAPFAYWIVNRFLRRLSSIKGFPQSLMLLSSHNSNVAHGHFQEIVRLYSLPMFGLRPAVIGEPVIIPGVGKTDIDVLTENGLWIESKRYTRTMGLSKELKKKLLVMIAAREQRLNIPSGRGNIMIEKLKLVNLNAVSPALKKFARDHDIEIEEFSVYAFGAWEHYKT